MTPHAALAGAVLCLVPHGATQAETADGLHYEVAGQGPAVVLIHGGGLDSRMWDAEFAQLAHRFCVVRYDVRGFGRSAPPADGHSHVQDLRSVLDAAGVEAASLVGLSLGGAIALNFALAYPDRTERLLLVAPALPGGGVAPEEPERFHRIGRLAAAGRTLDAVEEWLGSIHMAAAMENPRIAEQVRGLARANHRSWAPGPGGGEAGPPAAARLHEIAVPTAVLVGKRDDRGVRAQARRVAAGIPGATLDRVMGAGHIVNLEDPHAFMRWLKMALGRDTT